jgi:Ohr subfamily peroxiredoxin
MYKSKPQETAMATIETVFYTAKTRTSGGRDGLSRSSDGALDIKLSRPGPAADGTNPEQLLAAGWSACFIGAIGRAAGAMQIELPTETVVDAEVDLGKTGDAFQLQARLNVSLPGLSRYAAMALVEAAHELCPYSKAVRGNIAVELNLN